MSDPDKPQGLVWPRTPTRILGDVAEEIRAKVDSAKRDLEGLRKDGGECPDFYLGLLCGLESAERMVNATYLRVLDEMIAANSPGQSAEVSVQHDGQGGELSSEDVAELSSIYQGMVRRNTVRGAGDIMSRVLSDKMLVEGLKKSSPQDLANFLEKHCDPNGS